MTIARLFLDIHVLQTVPPSCVNRDDTGSPKTALYGGVQRARVSSQAWKRATRLMFDDTLDSSSLGTRTKRVVELIARDIREADAELADQALDLAARVLRSAKIKVEKPRNRDTLESQYLIFVSRAQVAALAQAAIVAHGEDREVEAKTAKALLTRDNSLDLALFGRMVADDTGLNVDAAAQVAHALSVHGVETEYDYFTAVDDLKARTADEEDAGAGMIGTVEFNSSTLYRYATVNLADLHHNVGNVEAVAEAVTTFLRAFVLSMPTGKQNTFANRTVPDAVVVSLRSDQPISLVGAFESALSPGPDGYVTRAVERLVQQMSQVDTAFGAAAEQVWTMGVGPAAEAVASLAQPIPLPALIDSVASTVGAQLQVPA